MSSRDGRKGASGRFIVFEGVEGCGKSTQIERLAARVQDLGRQCLVTREPGGTALGESIRGLLLQPGFAALDGLTELFLLSAARRHHVEETIRPALARGCIVLCDRFADSSVAYQGGGRGLDLALVERINRIATGGLLPDRIILLDLSPKEGLRRVTRRGREEDRLEREALEFHERVRATYLELARRKRRRYRVLDGQLPEADLAESVWRAVAPLF